MLYLVNGQDTERTRLALVKRKSIPFPPEPFRWFFIRLCQWAIKSADEHEGVGTRGSGPWTSSATASIPGKPEPRPRGPGFWLGEATMSAGYSSEPKFSIDFISAALRSRGCSPRAIFSLSTK